MEQGHINLKVKSEYNTALINLIVKYKKEDGLQLLKDYEVDLTVINKIVLNPFNIEI